MVVPTGPGRHPTLTALGPFDVIVDSPDPEDRLSRFEEAFYQLRPGGAYIVPGGATELGLARGPLGDLLAAAAATAPRRLHRRRPLEVNRLLAIRRRVNWRAVGGDLVLSHEIPDVLVKLRESELDELLERSSTPHRLIRTVPAEDPPASPPGTEGPQPRRPRSDRPIARTSLSLREYCDVVAAPQQVLVDGRLLLPETFRHHQWPVLTHSQLVDIAERFAVLRPRAATELPRLRGTYLHLDNEHRGHFGHLLTESLSRVWGWPDALAIDPDARVLVGATPGRPNLPAYELELYRACGIAPDRLVVIDRPVRVDRLISATPMFSHPQYVHPCIADTWRAVGDRLAASTPSRPWPRRFFVGRRNQTRSCRNGDLVERIFTEHGFETLYPEDHSLAEQVHLFRGAEAIGGYAGSGLFQLAFVPDPVRVVMVAATSYTPRNEFLIAAVNRHRLDALICAAEGRGLDVCYSFDAERDEPFLRRLLLGLT